MIKLIATDLDGTLFYPRRKRTMIAKANLRVLTNFREAGGNVVLVSGRSMHYGKQVFDVLGHEVDFIGCNSALVYHDKQLTEHFLPKNFHQIFEEIQKLYPLRGYMLMSRDVPLAISSPLQGGLLKLFYRIYYAAKKVYKEKYTTDDKVWNDEMKKGQLYKVMLYFGIFKKGRIRAREANKYLREHFPEIESSWSHGFIEITAKGISKGEGLNRYVEACGYTKDEVLVIGDSGNDISMFKAFQEHSFAMGKASPAVKKHAKHVAKKFSDIEKYIALERGKNNE